MVRMIASLGLIAACIVVAGDASRAQDQDKKKKRGKGILARVVSVELAKDAKDEGTLTVQVLTRKKKKLAAAATTQAASEEKKVESKDEKKDEKKDDQQDAKDIKITFRKDTKFEKFTKRKEPPAAATSADVQVGQAVLIRLREGEGKVADRILILLARKKKQQP
jgi:hypothetical protein